MCLLELKVLLPEGVLAHRRPFSPDAVLSYSCPNPLRNRTCMSQGLRGHSPPMSSCCASVWAGCGFNLADDPSLHNRAVHQPISF